LRIFLLLVVLLAALGVAGLSAPVSPAAAAEGDLFAPGTAYHATTYTGHANYHFWPDTAKANIVDLTGWRNADGRALDNAANLRLPVHAPGDGTVQQVSEGYGGGWGNSLIWTSADGREQIHVAHLDEVAKRGPVRAGELISYEGSTGYAVPSNFNHLHVSRMLDGAVAPVVLSGVTVEPDSHRQGRGTQRVYTAAPAESAPDALELEPRVGADPGLTVEPQPLAERPRSLEVGRGGERREAPEGESSGGPIGGPLAESLPLLEAYHSLLLLN